MDPLLRITVIKDHVKAARHGNDELVQPLVCVTTSLSPTRHVVEVVDPADIKRDVVAAFNESQVATGISNLWKLNDLAGVDI